MNAYRTGLVFVLSLLVMPGLCRADPPGAEDDWKLETVHLTRGRQPMRGLVTRETASHVHLKRVFRRRGSPTVVMDDRIARNEVVKIERLEASERERLASRLEVLARERRVLLAHLQLKHGGKVKLPPGEELTLAPARWGEDGKEGSALLYESTHFRLLSNAREDIVQLTGLHLEELYAAFTRCLPPQQKPQRPTTIVLARSMEDYQALVRKQKRNILNPAFYDPARDEVVCGCDLERMASAMEKARQKHQRDLADLQQRRAELSKIYGGKVPAEVFKPINDAITQMPLVEIKNEEAFKTSHRRLYQRLDHEAFHAYAASAVYPEKEGPLPIWLNEGLAQIFETGIVEAGEMRLGHADPERLALVRAALRKNELLPLGDLLRASPKQFLVGHTDERQRSDAHYLAAWALAFYLTFDRLLVGSQAMDQYTRELHRGADPLEAFRALVDKPLGEFEKDFRNYLQHLRSDGTTAR